MIQLVGKQYEMFFFLKNLKLYYNMKPFLFSRVFTCSFVYVSPNFCECKFQIQGFVLESFEAILWRGGKTLLFKEIDIGKSSKWLVIGFILVSSFFYCTRYLLVMRYTSASSLFRDYVPIISGYNL